MARWKGARSHQMLRTRLVVGKPLRETFAFFADARNLQQITPSWLSFSIVTPLPIDMRQHLVIDYRLRLYGLPLNWRTVIELWDPPHRFVDVQARGPYLLWRHDHVFTPVSEGTAVDDRVEYRVFGGKLIDRMFVRRDLRRIFTHRQHAILAHFGTAPLHPIEVMFE